MVEDLKVHQGGKKETDMFADDMLRLTKEWKEQGFTDDYILAFLELWTGIYTVPEPTEMVVGYAEI